MSYVFDTTVSTNSLAFIDTSIQGITLVSKTSSRLVYVGSLCEYHVIW